MCRHKDWINVCLRHAKKSEVHHYKHAAILVKGGKIISIGLNKNKAGSLGDPLYGLKGWHSELDALIELEPSKIKGAILYVAGWSKGKNVINSKPCKFCQNFIKKFPLKAVYYSTYDNDNNDNIVEKMI